MKNHNTAHTYISVGDFHISAKELEQMAPIEATLLTIIGRAVSAKLQRISFQTWSGDLVMHLYQKVRQHRDFSPSLDERILQQMVNNLLKNCIRDARESRRNADFAPLSFKCSFYDDDYMKIDNSHRGKGKDVSDVWADTTTSNDVAKSVCRKMDLATLRQFINHLPNQQRQCATMMYQGYSADEIGKMMGIRKTKVYGLMNKSLWTLRSLFQQDS